MRNSRAHFAAGSSPLSGTEAASIGGICGSSGAISLAAGIMPVGIAVKIKGVSEIVLDAPVLADILRAKITHWDDPRIAALNSEQSLPDQEITVILEKGPSETTRVVNDYLRSAPGISWNPEREDLWPSGVQGLSEAQSFDRANKLDEQDGGLAVLEGSLIGNRFSAAQLVFGEHTRKMDASSVVNAVAAGNVARDAHSVVQSLNSAEGYALASVIYVHFCKEYTEPAFNQLVRSYGEQILTDRAQKDANSYAFIMSPGKKAINEGLALIRTIGEVK